MTLKEERELKKAAKLEAEKQRIEAMREYEEMYDTFSYICGIDEAGRGPLAGPAKSLSIASASILAKVTRDRLMTEYDSLYPEYGFARHKGYGTKVHIEAIKEYGPCPIHRRTFIKNFI